MTAMAISSGVLALLLTLIAFGEVIVMLYMEELFPQNNVKSA